MEIWLCLLAMFMNTILKPLNSKQMHVQLSETDAKPIQFGQNRDINDLVSHIFSYNHIWKTVLQKQNKLSCSNSLLWEWFRNYKNIINKRWFSLKYFKYSLFRWWSPTCNILWGLYFYSRFAFEELITWLRFQWT